MKICKTFFKIPVLFALVFCACDLQPKIASIPDSIGMFIEDRYPALLADPETQPEIYNSAVTDYGVYASPELYGSSRIDDYVLYASVDDYVLVPEDKEEDTKPETTDVDEKIEQEISEDYLIVPLYGGNTVIEKQEEKITEEKIVVPEKKQDKKETKQDADTIIVVKGDTVYSLARKNNMTVQEFAEINNLKEPYALKIGQKLTTRKATQKTEQKKVDKPKQEIPNVISQEKVEQIKAEKKQKAEKIVVKETVKPNNTKRVDLQEITVAKGDTLYSLSRKYEIPVNDLAVMNKLSVPFTLSVGQKIKVPKLNTVQTRSATEVKEIKKAEKNNNAKSETKKQTTKQSTVVSQQKPQTVQKQPDTKVIKSQPKQQKTKISSDPKKQLPKISARSASKFSWPLRGKILSGYGPKKGGLVNDGINIGASLGTTVKAAENGVVAYAGNEVKGMGNLIIVQHSDGWMTVYAHLDSMSVKRGTKVSVGQPIGRVGKTGKVDKPQLHFEIRKGTKAYNPTQYLKK